MITKLVSSKAVISKIIADLDLKEDQIKITDFQEWIGEATEKIGAIQQLEQKNQIVPITQYQAQLPKDLYKLNQVAFSFNLNGGWLPIRSSTSSFCLFDSNDTSNVNMLVQDDALLPLVKNLFNLTSDKAAIDILNNDINIRQTLSTLLNQYTLNTSNGITSIGNGLNISNSLQYMLKPGYIVTNVPNGYVNISYNAIITDSDGLAMIPDNPSYFEAIYWYVTMKFKYPEYLNGRMPQHIYYDIRRSWNFYRKQAYAEAMMPTTDEMESIKNTWNTLMPEINEYDTFFSNIGDQQNIYNHNN